MSYLHIENLYRDKTILEFKKVYALEKIHGSNAWISYSFEKVPGFSDVSMDKLRFYAGATKQATFEALFDKEFLTRKFKELGHEKVVVYGEAYGGKLQGMSHTYGKELKFVAFEVKIGDSWLSVPQAHEVATALGFDFVDYALVDCTLEALEAEMSRDSVQAVKNGMGEGHKREGVVLRPPFECTLNNGERVICKYKSALFKETLHVREVSAEKLQVLEDANQIAAEYVTEMRLTHVLDKFPDAEIEDTGKIVLAMLEDVLREASGEIVVTKDVKKAIGGAAAKMFKQRLKEQGKLF